VLSYPHEVVGLRNKDRDQLQHPKIGHIVVEHKDRAIRFGVAYIQTLLALQGQEQVIVHTYDTAEDDLVAEFVTIITSFYARRRAKWKTEQVLASGRQAAGIAKSWRTNRQAAYDAHVEDLVNWKLAQEQNPDPKRKALHARTIKTSTTLTKRKGVWWLTLSFDEDVPLQTQPSAPRVGVDVGNANFITTSTGKHYGTFHGELAKRHERDREKRRRKAKLRACLKKKGVGKLPPTRAHFSV